MIIHKPRSDFEEPAVAICSHLHAGSKTIRTEMSAFHFIEQGGRREQVDADPNAYNVFVS